MKEKICPITVAHAAPAIPQSQTKIKMGSRMVLIICLLYTSHQVKETDYGTFMSMIEKKNIGEVEVKDNQIIFTDKDQRCV